MLEGLVPLGSGRIPAGTNHLASDFSRASPERQGPGKAQGHLSPSPAPTVAAFRQPRRNSAIFAVGPGPDFSSLVTMRVRTRRPASLGVRTLG